MITCKYIFLYANRDTFPLATTVSPPFKTTLFQLKFFNAINPFGHGRTCKDHIALAYRCFQLSRRTRNIIYYFIRLYI
jgi:hypothetical protein